MKKIISVILTFVIMLSMITIVQAADFSGGGYNFVCADGGRYLNVYAGKDADGTNVCVWERDGSPEQSYTISACGDGKYKLYPACSSSRVIDVNRGNSYNNPLRTGLNVDLWRTNDAPAQEFYITHVGNNLYKIGLAALSGHVLQANSPNKNNGNVTLERYNGASNQHWKILKNGSQVTEPCTHSRTYVDNEKTTIEQKDENMHSIIKTYDKLCSDCGKKVESNQKDSKIEAHNLVKNKCKSCGYEIVVEEPKEIDKKCTHSNTYNELKKESFNQKDDAYHTISSFYDTYCSECNDLIKQDEVKTKDEKHELSNNVCIKCDYKVADSKDEECKHTNTFRNKLDINCKYTAKNSEKHIITEYFNLACSDCNSIVKEKIQETYEENHNIETGKCLCGYKEPKREKTVNDGLYNIKNVASGYMMNVYAGKDANGTKVTVWENDFSNDQKVYISYQGDGKYLLKYNASKSGRVIDVNRGESLSASIDIGDRIDIWTADDSDAQLFYINDCGDGEYTFELVHKPGSVIAPSGIDTARTNGSQLVLAENKNADYQRWSLISTNTIRKTAYVYNTDGLRLNIRSSYNSNSSIVSKIPEYATITVVGEKISGFYPIEYNGYTGYAHCDYITFSVPQREEKITAWVYKTGNDNLNVRSAAVITSGNIIGKFSPNQQITVLGKTVQNGFYKVKYGSQTGYVSAAYVSFTKPVVTKPSSSTSSNSSSSSIANSAINNAQASASKGIGKVNFVKANVEVWKTTLDAKRQAAEAVYAVIDSVNIRTGIQKALGCTTVAVATLSPSKLYGVFDEDAVFGVLSFVVSNEYYMSAKASHDNFNRQCKNISNETQATKTFEYFREALAYYNAVIESNIDTVREYSSRANYTKNMLNTFFLSVADSAIPASEVKTLQKVCNATMTTGQILNTVKNNGMGIRAIRSTRTQWNNIWAKVK